MYSEKHTQDHSSFWEKCKLFFYYPIRLLCYTRQSKKKLELNMEYEQYDMTV